MSFIFIHVSYKNVEWDGNEHGITVTCSGATINYGTAEGTYDLTSSPTYKDVGTYTIYYQVSKEGYYTVTGSRILTITALPASKVSYTNSAVNGISNVKEVLDYLYENLKWNKKKTDADLSKAASIEYSIIR